ncbi:MAG TPA: hypothetical protein VJ647_04265 [Chitinophagaceae bacterium]|nr:hypothetical protein [Chitinophagaceae bacterium]
MKKLSQESTRIFLKLLKKMGRGNFIQLHGADVKPLNVELVEEEVTTTSSEKAKLYSVSHTLTQAGNLMRDPEMCFIVVDNRKDPADLNNVAVYPQLYRQDEMDLYEECVVIDKGVIKSYKPLWQEGHYLFATQWLKDIKEQGFLR